MLSERQLSFRKLPAKILTQELSWHKLLFSSSFYEIKREKVVSTNTKNNARNQMKGNWLSFYSKRNKVILTETFFSYGYSSFNHEAKTRWCQKKSWKQISTDELSFTQIFNEFLYKLVHFCLNSFKIKRNAFSPSVPFDHLFLI